MGACGDEVIVEAVVYTCRLDAGHDGRHEDERSVPGDSRVLLASWNAEPRRIGHA